MKNSPIAVTNQAQSRVQSRAQSSQLGHRTDATYGNGITPVLTAVGTEERIIRGRIDGFAESYGCGLTDDTPHQNVNDFPTIVADDNTYDLTSLVRSDFKMSTQDKDFSLTHEQVIKAVKVILYKFNLNSRKNVMERSELKTMLLQKMKEIEART